MASSDSPAWTGALPAWTPGGIPPPHAFPATGSRGGFGVRERVGLRERCRGCVRGVHQEVGFAGCSSVHVLTKGSRVLWREGTRRVGLRDTLRVCRTHRGPFKEEAPHPGVGLHVQTDTESSISALW